MKKCGNTTLGVSIGTRIPNTAEAWKRVYKEHKQEIAKVGVSNDPYKYFMTDRTFRISGKMVGAVDPILCMRRDMTSPVYLHDSNRWLMRNTEIMQATVTCMNQDIRIVNLSWGMTMNAHTHFGRKEG